MKVGKFEIELETLSEEELYEIIKQAKHVKARKEDARDLRENLWALMEHATKSQFTFYNKFTGEVFNLNDWLIHDDELDFLA